MRRARALALVTLIGAAALALACGACGETRRAVGEECLRNDDCLSGFCSARTCVGAPVVVGGPGTGVAGTRDDAGSDADTPVTDAGKDAPADAPADG